MSENEKVTVYKVRFAVPSMIMAPLRMAYNTVQEARMTSGFALVAAGLTVLPTPVSVRVGDILSQIVDQMGREINDLRAASPDRAESGDGQNHEPGDRAGAGSHWTARTPGATGPA